MENCRIWPPFSQLSIPVPWRLPLPETALTGILESIFHKSYPYPYNVGGGGEPYLFSHNKKMCSLASSITWNHGCFKINLALEKKII